VSRKLVLSSSAFRREGWYPDALAGMTAISIDTVSLARTGTNLGFAASTFVAMPHQRAPVHDAAYRCGANGAEGVAVMSIRISTQPSSYLVVYRKPAWQMTSRMRKLELMISATKVAKPR
jgi:hypothetical protein